MLTEQEHGDLSIRLAQLIGEYAAASQRNEAVAKLHAVLARVAPVAEEPVAVAPAEDVATEKPAEAEPVVATELPAETEIAATAEAPAAAEPTDQNGV